MKTKTLKKWTKFELSDEQTYQTEAGTYTTSVCAYCEKRRSRGYGPCEECINKELKRRGLSDG